MKESRMIKLGIIGFFLFWIVIILMFGSFFLVDAGDRAIVLTFGKPSLTIYQPGFHFKLPIIQHVITMSVRTQTISFDNKQGTGDNSEYSSLFAASKDLQDVQTATVVNYHINEKDVLDIYQKYGDSKTYQTNILEPIIRETVKTTSAQYTAEELVTKRAEFSDRVASLLSDRFSQKSAIFEKFNVVNFEFSASFTQAIEAKVTAEQNALAAKNKLEQVKYEAEQRITQANAEAQAIKIQTDAINTAGGANYVQLQAINKWNGQMPLVSGGSSMPFINFNPGGNVTR